MDEPLRCLNTGNLCGTDTWEEDNPCQCVNCTPKYHLPLTEDRLNELEWYFEFYPDPTMMFVIRGARILLHEAETARESQQLVHAKEALRRIISSISDPECHLSLDDVKRIAISGLQTDKSIG